MSDEFHQMVKAAMKDMSLPNSDTWAYEEPGNIIGFISITKNETGGLFVEPNQQSKRIGPALVHHISQFHDTLEVEVFEENKIEKPSFKMIKKYLMEETNQNVLRMQK